MANAPSPPHARPMDQPDFSVDEVPDKVPAPINPVDPVNPIHPVNLDNESVAGEEDPGASLDMFMAPIAPIEPIVPLSSTPPAVPAGSAGQPPSQRVPMPPADMAPGDEAAEGSPGTAQAICRECGASGRTASGACPSCNGSGKVTVGLGGA